MINNVGNSNKTNLCQKSAVDLELTASSKLVKNTTLSNNTDTVEISNKAFNASKIDQSADQNFSLIYESINNDPKFADQMAYVYSHSPDFEITDLKNVPINGNSNTIQAYLKHENDFEIRSKNIMNNRIAIYNQMKTAGASGSDIFNKIMEFNKNLPIDYQKITGIDKYFDLKKI